MNPEQKAARAFLKRKMSAGAGGIAGDPFVALKRPKLPLTFEEAVRERRKALKLSESLARSKKPGTA
jgi:hypothetical protein